LNPGDVVTVTVPIPERTVRTTIGGRTYTLLIRGNEVISMDPPGRWYPFYQRAHYRGDRIRWVKRERFVGT
jgi:hypothetical protein